MKRSIILPAYNESGYIAEMVRNTVLACEQSADPFEILAIDNASKDETAAIVERIAAADPRVRLLRHETNRLYAGSCLTGVRASTGDRIFILDSDGQHPPIDLWKFDAKLAEGCDLVFGWRRQRAEGVQRLVMSRVLWSLARFYTGFNHHDVNCGIRGFSRRYADALEIKYKVNLVNPELFVRARIGNFTMGEVEVVQEARKAGVSSHELGRLWRIFQAVTSYLAALRAELRHAGSRPHRA
jgi:glycosyltransferase involved in cell wall biosynthesis